MKYYLGLDNGGTTTKAALFEQNGRELGSVSTSTAVLTPKPGFAERDMEEMWQANCRVIRGVLEKCGVDAHDILGVGICGHGKGLYLWGRDGRPVRNGISSTDNRAYAYPLRWREDGTEKKVFAISCQHIMACQPVSLLAWLRDNEPEAYGNIRWVFECKDYIRFRLTGQARAELTDYSGANLLDLRSRSYSRELLRLFGLEDIFPALPPLCRSDELCGTVSAQAAGQCGLIEGTPVAGGMFDIDACALAAGVSSEDNICMIAGTWSINEYLSPRPVTDGSVLMNSLFCLPEYYLIEESSPTSAGNHAWFMSQLLPELEEECARSGRSAYEEADRWVEAIAPEEFVPVFLPFLMASNVHPNARGSFIGLSAGHSRRHMLRSVYEGIVFSHKYHLDRLMKSRAQPPRCIRLAGGAARSPVWTQMFADILQLPVETVNVTETGALGCAMAAAAATGRSPSLRQAAGSMCSVSPAVQPRKEFAGIYSEKYSLYLKAIACLDGLWDDMQALIERRS